MPYTPLAGKYGKVTVNGVTLHLSEWSPNVEVDVIDVSGFNATADADQNILEQFLTGLMKGEFTIKGRYDSQSGKKPHAAPVNLRPGLEVTAFLGYSQDVGFTVTAKVIAITGGTAVRDAGNFEARIKATALTYPS